MTPVAVDKSPQRIRQMFAQIATDYDRMNHLLSMNVDRYWRWRMVRIVNPRGTAPILDVCTGTGDLALAYLKRTAGRVPVVATDFCPAMLRIGRRKKNNSGINGQLTFVEADTHELPFDDDFFQIVSVAFGLRNVANTSQGLREMRRVCAPGGRVAVLEFSMPRRQPIKALYGWYFRHLLPRIGQWITSNDQSAYEYLPASVDEFPTGDALAARMREVGLGNVRYYALTMGIATLYVGEK
jgi:demethylmenaquinone methyltransferase/2-methoxy-6-polyprenyl-1,4-benzoquinol methylase